MEQRHEEHIKTQQLTSMPQDDSQRQLLLDAQATVLLDVAQSYYQVLRSEAQVVVLTNSLKVQQARLADSQSRYHNHLALALEVSQTQAQVASTSATLTQAQSDVRNGRHMLAFLIGVSKIVAVPVFASRTPMLVPPNSS